MLIKNIKIAIILICAFSVLTSCSIERKLPDCWTAESFKSGEMVSGRVLIVAPSVGGIIIFPTNCSNLGLVAEHNELELRIREKMGAKLMVPIEKFAIANIHGQVTVGLENFRRPRIKINEVDNIDEVKRPVWFGNNS